MACTSVQRRRIGWAHSVGFSPWRCLLLHALWVELQGILAPPVRPFRQSPPPATPTFMGAYRDSLSIASTTTTKAETPLPRVLKLVVVADRG